MLTKTQLEIVHLLSPTSRMFQKHKSVREEVAWRVPRVLRILWGPRFVEIWGCPHKKNKKNVFKANKIHVYTFLLRTSCDPVNPRGPLVKKVDFSDSFPTCQTLMFFGLRVGVHRHPTVSVFEKLSRGLKNGIKWLFCPQVQQAVDIILPCYHPIPFRSKQPCSYLAKHLDCQDRMIMWSWQLVEKKVSGPDLY